MNPRNLAFKFLGLLAPGRHALAGDLLEQVRNGRSTLWLWRQVLGVIFTGCVRDLREDRIGALKVVAIGWASMLAFFFIAGDLLAHSGDQTVPRLLSYLG